MKKKLFAIFGALFSLSFISCGKAENSEIIELWSGWEYSLENPIEKNVEFSVLPEESLKNLQELVPEQKGTIWLQKKFTLPQSLKGKDISCYLGRIALADRTYLNGSLIGSEGYFAPKEFSAWNTTRFYEIPEELLNADGENSLLVEIFVEGEGSIVSRPFIGTHDQTKRAASRERFWNSQINALFAFVMLIIAFYHFLVWIKGRNQKESFYFALINIISVLYMSVFYLSELPGGSCARFSFIWFQKIFSSAMPFALPFLINSFVNHFFNRKDNKIIFVLRILFFVIPVIVIFCAPDYVHLRSWRIFYQPFLLPPIAYIVFLIFRACIKKQKDAVPLLLGFTPLLITMFLDVALHDWLKIYSLPYFTSIGWQLVVIALLFVLVNRFANAKNEADYLNVHLSDEVEARTKELSASNEQLTHANEQLEHAKQTAERDMNLAVYVQQSFFPRHAPDVSDWDVSYLFRPSAGVSGDFYDFYSEGKKLTGLALFDVSGHGIASGLVTMLAKNAVAREFSSDMNIRLGTVMKNINDRIIQDKGNVENYMTGVLIRVDGNKVQLINAGHPMVFLRKANGKCYSIQLKSEDGSAAGGCGLIGIAELDVDFKAMQFTVEKDDALILYTDCLSEARNVEGEEFGQDRVRETFERSRDGNAQSKLDYVLDTFERFTEGQPLKDDLTVIVLQKK